MWYNDAIGKGVDVKLSAIISNSTTAKAGTKYKMTFTGSINVPEGYTVTGYGMLIVKNPAGDLTSAQENMIFTNDTLNGQKISKVQASVMNNAGQYKVTITSVPKATTVAARAFLVYEKDGETFYTYSDIVYLSTL